jgi:alkyl hydroperoxide reductase subunit AhpC
MTGYSRDLARFAAFDAQVVGVSVDSTWSHIAWQEKEIGMLAYPLASDFYPHGETAQKYGVFRTGDPIPGINERALFIVDKAGMIVWSQRYELGEAPENEELFDALAKLAQRAHSGAQNEAAAVKNS